jgi:hypothetical protein
MRSQVDIELSNMDVFTLLFGIKPRNLRRLRGLRSLGTLEAMYAMYGVLKDVGLHWDASE